MDSAVRDEPAQNPIEAESPKEPTNPPHSTAPVTTKQEPQLVLENKPSVLEEARKKYKHILTNDFLFGANGKAPEMTEMAACECRYEDGDDKEKACGSECINRHLFIECTDQVCGSGSLNCQNRRFQKCQYASMEIIKTEKKGFGLRATEDIKPGQFVIEYCGEVIPQHVFALRTREYAEQGVEHFYFMSLKNDEIIDAQKKGNWSRFMNHSCDPNCLLQKWNVGNQVRVGMFAKSFISKGDELTFDYKFERYGAKAQPCYCGSANCKGVIGGEQRAEMIDYEDDGDETLVDGVVPGVQAFKEKVIKPIETIKDLQDCVQKMLYVDSKPQVMKRIIQRLEATSSINILRRFVQFHGLLVLKNCIKTFLKSEDILACNMILSVLKNLPISSRNTVTDSKIEELVTKLTEVNEMHTAAMASELLQSWSTLQFVYKIPKRIPGRSNDTVKKEEEPKPEKLENGLVYAELMKEFDIGMPFRSYSRDKDIVEKQEPVQEKWNRSRDRRSRSRSRSRSRRRIDEYSRNRSRSRDRRDLSRDRYKRYRSSSRDRDNYSRKEDMEMDISSASDSEITRRKSPEFYDMSADLEEMTKASIVIDESLLPPNWRTAKTEDGEIYYYNKKTKETSWDPPNPDGAKKKTHKRKSKHTHSQDKDREQRKSKEAIENTHKHKAAKIEQAKGDSQKPRTSSGDPDLDEEDTYDESKSKLSKELRSAISQVVVKHMSRYKDQIDPSKFKKYARKYTHQILEKEERSTGELPTTISDDMKHKIKKFLHTKLKTQGLKLIDESKRKE